MDLKDDQYFNFILQIDFSDTLYKQHHKMCDIIVLWRHKIFYVIVMWRHQCLVNLHLLSYLVYGELSLRLEVHLQLKDSNIDSLFGLR